MDLPAFSGACRMIETNAILNRNSEHRKLKFAFHCFEVYMPELNQTRIEALGGAFCKARVAVLGDLMLDRYTFGTVSRISPEAPVPVLEIESEQARLGGAANVGHNIVGLGATPKLSL